jgi:hypothetical protein
MMVGCIWLMRRCMTSRHETTTDAASTASTDAKADELAALRDEVARLRQRDQSPAAEGEEAR